MRRLTSSLFLFLIIAGVLTLNQSNSRASNASLLSEDFSSGSFPPSGWKVDNDNGFGVQTWVRGSVGLNGSNGSACAAGDRSLWGQGGSYGTGGITSPSVDVSGYTSTGDSVILEFDFWCEYTYYTSYWGSNYLDIDAQNGGSVTLMQRLSSGSDYTFYNSGSTGYYYPPLSTPSYWRHYAIVVPNNLRTSDLAIDFYFTQNDYGYSGIFAIDNVVIRGYHPPRINFNPASLTFNTKTAVLDTSTQQCITFSNAESIPLTVSNLRITGTNASDFFIVGTIPSVVPAAKIVGAAVTPSTTKVCVRFAPSDSGLRIATITLNSSGAGQSTVNLTITGTGVLPTIQPSVSSLFVKTNVRLQSSKIQSFLVTNIGVGQMKISPTTSISGNFPGDYSIVQLPQGILRTGQSDTIKIKFSPTVEGLRSAVLTVRGNFANTPPQIQLRGVGVLPHLVALPSPLQFDSVNVGDTACKNITIYNPGTDTLAIFKNFFTSADADFTLHALSGEDTLVAPGDSAIVGVCFSPIRNGTREARFRIINNIPLTFETPNRDTSIVVVNITGTGVSFGQVALNGFAGTDSVIVNTQDCKTVTLRNSGDADLTINSTSFTGPNSTEFTLSGVTTPFTIPVGGSRTATLCVEPTDHGFRNANLILAGTSSGEAINSTVPLVAYGLSVCQSGTPNSLFTTVTPINHSDTGTVTITNCGDVAETYTASIPNNCSGYTIIGSTTSGSIAPGGTATYQVVFSPTASGSDICQMAINGIATGTTAATTPTMVDLTGTGACATIANNQFEAPRVAVGESSTFTVTLTNNGNLTWTPGTPSVSAGQFTNITIDPSTIAPGGTATMTVTFTPSSIGNVTGTVSFPNAAGVECSTYSLSLSGEGVANGVSDIVNLDGFMLEQNYPNPFNPLTEIGYTVPRESTVTLTITDIKGVVVKTLVNERMSQGHHTAHIDARDIPSGVYYYTLTSGSVKLSKQMVVTK